MGKRVLTSCSAKELVKSEGEQGIRHFPQKPLQQCGELNGILFREADSCRILVKRFGDLLKFADISIVAKYPFHSHI